ncbi:TRAP transporter small permease [Afifella sp. H1R]|uniref:TRAP transporter small permease n=1 Tax=Afifella sp. H1R TaxID=2908841 RepID=UPI001F2AA7BE|nr:TRAP transporter small permease [Afifella sp. H1R]MCF1505460.1 TRAP transporter small permease [Afifella sp. H1R]
MRTRAKRFVTHLEENFIALLLAAMTLTQFTQVVARYVFHSGWTGALEFTRILFAWLILFGMAYGVKIGAHLGVDVMIRALPRPLFKVAAIFGALTVLLYAVILLYSDWLQYLGANSKGGAIAYWTRFYHLPLGLDDLRYPVWAQETFGAPERVQRWVAYLMLPIGLFLLALRSLQATVAIVAGRRELIVAAHEAEELVAEHEGSLDDDDDDEEEPFEGSMTHTHPHGYGRRPHDPR